MTPHAPPSTVAMRKEALELRKTLKPLVEKRRRARINDSLHQLKTLILPLVGKEKCRYSKLEKADILEMTVRFLTDIPVTPKKDVADNYKEGYKACLQRVSALLPRTGLDHEAGRRVTEFMQRAMPSSSPACQHCSGHGAPATPQTPQQRLRSLQATVSRSESRASVVVPVSGAPVWRPW
ncbi:transcription factor HES-2-like [Astyanax mexicanus]|uniref:Hes family bHLH transcription factor 2 n=1 Tax=Astyanax mexicanus TaxID=7994 RepID=A0A8B9KKT7_ASTMX|nr:transcription factor HES-2-like [Astyanax mexicanus]